MRFYTVEVEGRFRVYDRKLRRTVARADYTTRESADRHAAMLNWSAK